VRHLWEVVMMQPVVAQGAQMPYIGLAVAVGKSLERQMYYVASHLDANRRANWI
jgi:hypothetical protein